MKSITKKDLILTSVSAVIALLLPFLAVKLISGDGGMAVCFILFFAVNPIYAIVCGAFSGAYLKNFWFQPVSFPILFLLGTWLLFDMGEVAFVYYTLGYLALGLLSMAIAVIAKKCK